MTAKYKCGNEVRVNDIVKCVQDPHSSQFPGRASQFYRVAWVRGGSEGSARDITLDGLEKKDCSPDAYRFILISRDGKKAPLPAMPTFKPGDIVRDKFNKSSEFSVTYCGLDRNVDWRVNLVGQAVRAVRTDELASQYETMPPQATPPKFKEGDIVRVRGGRPEWKVYKVHNIGREWQYSLTFLLNHEQGSCGLYLESSLSPCGEVDSLQDFCATMGVDDAKTRNIYHFVETKLLQPLRDKLAQIKEIAK